MNATKTRLEKGSHYRFSISLPLMDVISCEGVDAMNEIAESYRPEEIRDFYLLDISYHIAGYKRNNNDDSGQVILEINCTLE